MGYQQHAPVIYLVTWPGDLVIKPGFSMQQRWRTFCRRGAQVEMLCVAPSRPLELEAALDREISSRMPAAFEAGADAAKFLGGRGAGWKECYRAASSEALSDAVASCIRIMRSHPGSACGTSIRLAHARTDGQDGQDVDASLTLLRNSKVLNAHEKATIRSGIQGRS